jgi:hypothetical protein
MIPAERGTGVGRWTAHPIKIRFGLAPVAFYPDIATAAMVPVPFGPTSMGMGRFDVGPGNPDVAIAVPTVVAGVPCPVRMFVRRRRHDLVWALRWGDADYDLGLCNACGENKRAGNSGEEFLHRAISL